MQHLFAQFESLGANCEFGFVQRQAGIEPPDLLRWSMVTSPRALVAAIDADFADLYAFDSLVPYNQAMVRDQKHDIAFHSALRCVAAGAGFAFAQPEQDRRDIHRFEAAKVAQHLKRFRACVASGERMFVFHKFNGTLTPREIAHLFATLRLLGPARLLVVSRATAEHQAGEVIAHVPGLLHGYIDRFAPGERAFDVSFDLWARICRAALAMAPPAA